MNISCRSQYNKVSASRYTVNRLSYFMIAFRTTETPTVLGFQQTDMFFCLQQHAGRGQSAVSHVVTHVDPKMYADLSNNVLFFKRLTIVSDS